MTRQFKHRATNQPCRNERAGLSMGLNTHGFSVITLRVAISIIAMLIAILLPGLQALRQVASFIKCLSNLGEIEIAQGVYAQHDIGRIPIAFDRPVCSRTSGLLAPRLYT